MCANKWLMLNCDCYIATLKTISLCAKKNSGSFENAINKMCLQIIYIFIIYIYEDDMALCNLQLLISYKTKQTPQDDIYIYIYQGSFWNQVKEKYTKNVHDCFQFHISAIQLDWFRLVSFFLMAYQLFVGYLMSKPFSEKNSSGTILPIAGRKRGFIPFQRVFARKWT